MKPMAEWLRDAVDPGWREREIAHFQQFLEAIPRRCNCMRGACQQWADGCRDRAKTEPACKAP
jgi:hypothetical protein